MKRLDLYLGWNLVVGTLLAWFAIGALEFVFALLGEVADIGRGRYGLHDALMFVLLSAPQRAYAAFPMAALIGALLGLGRLAAGRELTAFGLAGCSPARLLRAVLQAGVLMLVLAVALGEGVAPFSGELARQWRAAALYDEVGVQRDAGFWVRDGQRFIQVGQSAQDGSLLDIRVYEFDAQPRLRAVTAVERARYEPGGWRMQALRQTRFSDGAIELTQQDSDHWKTLVDPRLARLLMRDPAGLGLPELRHYIAHLRAGGGDARAYELAWWQRWSAPLTALAMLLLGASLVLGPMMRQGLAQRLLAGVAIGLAFKLLVDIAAHAGLVYGLAPWLSALLPPLLVLGAGVLLLRRYA